MENDTVPLTHGAASTDGNYNGVGIADVAVTVTGQRPCSGDGGGGGTGQRAAGGELDGGRQRHGLQGAVEVGQRELQHHRPAGRDRLGFDHEPHDHRARSNATRYTVRVIATWTGTSDGPPSAEAMGRPRGESGGICGRTPAVRDALLVLIEENEGAIDCADVSAAHLAAITGRLDLSGQGIAALKAGDFAGLTGLTQLYLYGNALSSLPGPGVCRSERVG